MSFPLLRRAAASLLGASLLLVAASASAEDGQDDTIEEVVVTAHPLSGEGLSEPAIALDGGQLDREAAASIGDTVSRQAGIHSASFGTAVGRPVVHGMDGPRVRVMEDRIDAMDVSVSSADHAVTIEPFLAERVEVVKGPSTLLYGSGAIGGVVNVDTGRIPRAAADGFDGKVSVRAADNADSANATMRLGGGNGTFAWHVDGFTRSAEDYDIPGFAESAGLRAMEVHDEHDEEEEHEGEDEHEDEHAEDEHEEEEEAYGTLPGSYSNGSGGAIGLSWVGDRGFFGVAVSRLNYDYGLPGGSHAHHHEEEEHHDEDDDDHHEMADDDHDEDEDEHHDDEEAEGAPTLDLEQTRIDVEAGIVDPFAHFSALNVRIGRNDYAHVEIEPNAEVGTRFAAESFEVRIELLDDNAQGFDGALGVQFGSRDFSAIGAESFVPPVETSTAGLFWVGERDLESFDLETGFRLERTSHDPLARDGSSFTTFSTSLGAVTRMGEATLGIHGGYSSRAPSAEELYTYGPHLVVQSFEIGDPNLDAEKALSLSATVSVGGERASFTGTAYMASFRDHITHFATGEERDELRVVEFGQEDAFYRGLDLAASFTIAESEAGSVGVDLLLDTVAAEIDVAGNDRLPRLPPTRIGAGLNMQRGRLSAEVDWLRVFEQDETAEFELPTDAYTDVRLHVAADFQMGAATMRAFLQGRNLTDSEQRHHSSAIKEYAPMPGRTWEIGLRAAF